MKLLSLTAGGLVWAQDNALLSVLRGTVIAWDAGDRGGTVTVRDATGAVERCSLDDRSYFSRQSSRLPLSQGAAGIDVELIADRNGPAKQCYARTVRVLPPRAGLPVVAAPRSRQPLGMSELDLLLPRGNMTFSAVVLRVAPEVLTVRVRGDAQEKTVILRPDTRFLAHGSPVTETALRPNTKVFLRAGKNLDGQLEAFQVVWGDILQPQ